MNQKHSIRRTLISFSLVVTFALMAMAIQNRNEIKETAPAQLEAKVFHSPKVMLQD